jgi:aminoglycoside phosphotransferase family enzyme
MSWVFIAGDLVYKLKKPVRFPYLDFSTCDRREAACRAELAINQRLAPHVYLRVVPLTAGREGMAIGGQGTIVDWLVVMRRLAEDSMLDRAAPGTDIDARKIDQLADRLADFYLHARPALLNPAVHLGMWRNGLATNRRVLSASRFRLDPGNLALIDRAQQRFLIECWPLLTARVRGRRIIDGHGDLRPEHVSLAEPVAIIDRIEFDPRLRLCDPFDELAAFAVDCDALGLGTVGERLRSRVAWRLRDQVNMELFAFYRCYRATLRARLAIAHLLDPDCRTPEEWPVRAQRYLALAAIDAQTIEVRAAARRRQRHKNPGFRAGHPAGRSTRFPRMT